MNNSEDEILKISVKYGKKDKDTQLILTDKQLIFEQEKGLFIKKFKPIYTLLIDDIKMHDDKVKIEQKTRMVVIYTNYETVNFTCDNVFDARRIIDRIINIKTDSTVLDRTADKAKKIITGAVAAVGFIGTAAAGLNKNKKEILKGVKFLTSIFKK